MYEWLWGINVLVWEKNFINYLVLLNMTLRQSPSPTQIFTKAALMTVAFLANLILYYKARRGAIFIGIDATVFPISIALVAALYAAAQVRIYFCMSYLNLIFGDVLSIYLQFICYLLRHSWCYRGTIYPTACTPPLSSTAFLRLPSAP